MPAYLVVKMFKTLRVGYTAPKYTSDSVINTTITADNPFQLNWNIITAANKYEADGKAKELLETWLVANKESFDKYREGANNVSEQAFVWEIDNTNALLIANMMVNALKET